MINNHGKKNNIATSKEAQALVGNKRRFGSASADRLCAWSCVALFLLRFLFCSPLAFHSRVAAVLTIFFFVLFLFVLFLFVRSFVVMDDCTTTFRHCVSVLPPPPLVCSCIAISVFASLL